MNNYDYQFDRDEAYYDSLYEDSSPIMYALDRYDQNGEVLSVTNLEVHFTSYPNEYENGVFFSRGEIEITDIYHEGKSFEVSKDEHDEILKYLQNTCKVGNKSYYVGY